MQNQKDERWVEGEKARIRDAFALFDKEKRGAIMAEEVPTVIRYLGVYPTERALMKEILPELQEDEPTALIPLERFEQKVLSLLYSRQWAPDMDDTLLQAFRALDEDGTGIIEAAKMREMLMSKGTPFREKEFEAFLSVAKDPETGHIQYEDYIAMMSET